MIALEIKNQCTHSLMPLCIAVLFKNFMGLKTKDTEMINYLKRKERQNMTKICTSKMELK